MFPQDDLTMRAVVCVNLWRIFTKRSKSTTCNYYKWSESSCPGYCCNVNDNNLLHTVLLRNEWAWGDGAGWDTDPSLPTFPLWKQVCSTTACESLQRAHGSESLLKAPQHVLACERIFADWRKRLLCAITRKTGVWLVVGSPNLKGCFYFVNVRNIPYPQ